MVLGQERRAIGVFTHENALEAALNDLRSAGYPMERVSIVTKDSDKAKSIKGRDINKSPGHKVGTGAAVGSVTGTALGLAGGLIASAAALTIPGFGPILATGTIASVLGTTFAGGGVGAISGGLVGAIAGLGIPGDKAKVYSDRLSRGDYLLIVEGKSDEIMRAEMILLNNHGIEEWGIYDIHHDDPSITGRTPPIRP
jgi:hypothetical protein